jgi:tRNA G18 (ribose-2'-O)-methylase SpoU
MPPIPIDDLSDPRLAPYRMLKERELAREGGRFIAEGEQVVRRLLASDVPCESVLLAERRAGEIGPIVPDEIPVYVVPDGLVREIIGFAFHSGVIAVGVRPRSPTVDEVMGAAVARAGEAGRVTFVVCPEIANVENLGALVRIAAAFGADAMVLGERSCDPFFRQAVRVSMGAVFRLPMVRSTSVVADLARLRERWGVELAATVLADDAEPLAACGRAPRFGLLFGNEAQGLAPEHVAACDRKVTIPMHLGTDSLNVAVSAAVCLYHFTMLARVEVRAGQRH